MQGEETRSGKHEDKERKKGKQWGGKTGEGQARKKDQEEEGEEGLPEEMHSFFETEMRKKV